MLIYKQVELQIHDIYTNISRHNYSQTNYILSTLESALSHLNLTMNLSGILFPMLQKTRQELQKIEYSFYNHTEGSSYTMSHSKT